LENFTQRRKVCKARTLREPLGPGVFVAELQNNNKDVQECDATKV